MKVNLDLLEEEREKAIVRVAAYQQQLTSYYNKKAKIRQFQPGDLVLRKTFITSPRQLSFKLQFSLYLVSVYPEIQHLKETPLSLYS
ncbi:unnamed protein product [Prunus armeniaca]